MRFFATTAASLAVLAIATVAPGQAADLQPVYDTYDWSGSYLGIIGAGAVDGTAKLNRAGATSGDFKLDGFTIGLMTSYNFQRGNIVFGITGDNSYADIDGSTSSAGCVTRCRAKIQYMGSTRARVGYAFDRFLPYVTGGISSALVDESFGGSNGKSKFHFGYAVGGGLEWAFADGWAARAEYLYIDYGSKTHSHSGPNVKTHIDDLHMVRGGISMNVTPVLDRIFGF